MVHCSAQCSADVKLVAQNSNAQTREKVTRSRLVVRNTAIRTARGKRYRLKTGNAKQFTQNSFGFEILYKTKVKVLSLTTGAFLRLASADKKDQEPLNKRISRSSSLEQYMVLHPTLTVPLACICLRIDVLRQCRKCLRPFLQMIHLKIQIVIVYQFLTQI